MGAVDHDTVLLMASAPCDFAVLAGDDEFASPAVRLPLLPARRDTVSAATSLLSQIDRTATHGVAVTIEAG